MKYILDLETYNSLYSNTLNESDLKAEENKETSKWGKVMQWIKKKKTPLSISIGSIAIISIAIKLYTSILKDENESNRVFNDKMDSAKDTFKKDASKKDKQANTDINTNIDIIKNEGFVIPVSWKDKRGVDKIVSDIIIRIGLDKNNPNHMSTIIDIEDAVRYKIEKGQDIDLRINNADEFTVNLYKKNGIEFDRHMPPPLTFSRDKKGGSNEWNIQNMLEHRIEQLEYFLNKLKGENPELELYIKDINYGKLHNAIQGIKMSYFGKARDSKIEILNIELDKVYSYLMNIMDVETNPAKLNNMQKLLQSKL